MFWLIELAFIVLVFGGLALLVWHKSKQLNKDE